MYMLGTINHSSLYILLFYLEEEENENKGKEIIYLT